MANEQRQSQLSWTLGQSLSRLAAMAYFACPIIVMLGFFRHETFVMGFSVTVLALFQSLAAIWIIFDPPLRPPPRDPPFILAITAVALTPVLLFVVWPGDPFAFPFVASVTVMSYVVMPAAQLTALLWRQPPKPVRIGFLVAGIVACLAFLAAYFGLFLTLTQGGSAELLHPQAARTTLWLGAPAAALFGFVAFLLVLTMAKPPASP